VISLPPIGDYGLTNLTTLAIDFESSNGRDMAAWISGSVNPCTALSQQHISRSLSRLGLSVPRSIATGRTARRYSSTCSASVLTSQRFRMTPIWGS
jgi:hypothetical protein